MAGEAQKGKNLENALKGLVKLIKAIRYYPPAHPSLRAAIAEARQGFLPLVQQVDCFTFVVRKEGFFLDDEPVAAGNPLLQKLAPFFFARRIQRLTFLPDLSLSDLQSFARCLSLDPAEILRLGGIQEVLRQARVSTIWVNEVDLARILARKEEIEAQKKALAGGEPGAADDLAPSGQEQVAEDSAATTSEGRDLERVLRELQQAPSDQRFRLLLDELVPLVRLNLTEAGRNLVLRALAFLSRQCSSRQQTSIRREHARHALMQLTSDDVLDFLVAILCRRETQKETREQVLRLLVFFGEKVTRRLMDHLAEESEAQARKYLAEALVRQGSAATPVILHYLGDERWYVVRNAVAILGESRAREAAGHFPPLLGHADFRVRRETIRALARIGGREALGILLHMAESGDPELRPQALLSLGAMKDPAAVPTLLRLAGQTDPWVKNPEVKKEAIRALGEIGSPEAVPTLLGILRQRKFWRRDRFDEVRVAAAVALGDIGGTEATAALQDATDDRSPTVARAAAGALKQRRKGSEHESGNP